MHSRGSQTRKRRQKKDKEAERRERIKMAAEKKRKYAGLCRCSVSGDPHYKTFDRAQIDFMGTCEYTLARSLKDIGNCSFDITVQNEHRKGRKSVSYTKRVNINMYGMEVSLLKDNTLLLNGVRRYLPLTVDGRFEAVKNTKGVKVISQCGVEVSFRDGHYAEVSVPKQFAGHMTGLCGSCNGVKKDDFRTQDGQMMSDSRRSAAKIGQSYLVESLRTDLPEACRSKSAILPPPPECSEQDRKAAETACGALLQRNGPFGECLGVKADDAREAYESCVFDYCIFIEDQNEAENLMCDAMMAFGEECWESGIEVMWRSESLCPPTCGANSHYSDIMPSCAPSCANPIPSGPCTMDTQEGCLCDHGFLMSDAECVPASECGCVDVETDSYYPTGAIIVSLTCNTTITCVFSPKQGYSELLSIPAPACGQFASCDLVAGQR